jgi:hypothetical protein
MNAIISSFITAFDSLVDLYGDMVIDSFQEANNPATTTTAAADHDNDRGSNARSILFADFLLIQLNRDCGGRHSLLLKVLLLAVGGQVDAILREINRKIIAVYSLLSPSSSSATMAAILPDGREDTVECIANLTQLQQLIFLQRFVVLSMNSANDLQQQDASKPVSDASCKQTLFNTLQSAFGCEDDAATAIFDLLIAITVRLGFTIIAGAIHSYDHMAALLKCPLRIMNPSVPARHSSSSASLASSSSTSTASPSRIKSNPNLADAGFDYYFDITRQEAIQILVDQPPGRFLLRPHESQPNQMFLSFRSLDAPDNEQEAESASAAASDNSNLVRHAILRIDESASSSTSANVYRCGKIGPCLTLNELLQ